MRPEMVVEPDDGSGWSDREMPDTPKEGKISVRTKNLLSRMLSWNILTAAIIYL